MNITKKELEKKLGKARMEGYEMGKKHMLYPANHKSL